MPTRGFVLGSNIQLSVARGKKRDRIDPGAFLRISPEEAAQRAAEEAEREQQARDETARIDARPAERQADAAARAARIREQAAPAPRPGDSILVSTADDLPGSEITEVLGEVHGLVVKSRGPFSDTAARVRTAVGGEVRSYQKLMSETRGEAVARLRDSAFEMGADAVVAMRFDTTAITDEMVEVAAYGTAVTVAEQ